MKPRHFFTIMTAAFLLSFQLTAQQYDYMDRIRQNPELMAGCDYLCPTGKTVLTPSPKGYKPLFVSYYGRHGARYAWQSDLYENVRDLFHKADSADNLTASGRLFLEMFDSLYPSLKYNSGILSRKGWNQQKEMGERMYSNFPEAFPDGAYVRAASSTTGRCIMTMSAFCLGLKGSNPALDVEEFLGPEELHAILPQSGENPFRVKKPLQELPFQETWEQYIERTLDYRAILGRLFKDVDAAVEPSRQWDALYNLNYFTHGMLSLDTDLRFDDFFTFDERVALWKIDCFQFYCHGFKNIPGYRPIVEDIISRSDARLASGSHGADIRIGHDSTTLPLMMLLGVNGYGHVCTDTDEIPVWCRLQDVGMGANLQFVFYTSRSGGDVLFKLLLNGEEAHLPLQTDIWPYYRWEDFKQMFN